MPAAPLRRSCLLLILLATFVISVNAEFVPVRRPVGSAHAFLTLRTLDGATIATGDIIQSVHGARITSRIFFHFRDGSLDDETATFTQHGTFHLITDHHIQHGPSFPKPIDTFINAQTGEIITRGEDGKTTSEHMDVPPDLANGLALTLLLNIVPTTAETKLPLLVPSSKPGTKPRLVHLSIKPAGDQSFTVGGRTRKATDYSIHIDLGGITGVVAPIVGKQPPDAHVWVLIDPAVPAFIREEGQLYQDGPVWRIEQTSPSFSH